MTRRPMKQPLLALISGTECLLRSVRSVRSDLTWFPLLLVSGHLTRRWGKLDFSALHTNVRVGGNGYPGRIQGGVKLYPDSNGMPSCWIPRFIALGFPLGPRWVAMRGALQTVKLYSAAGSAMS